MAWPEEGFLVKTPRNIHEHSWTVLYWEAVENPTASLFNSDNKLQETNDGDTAAKEGSTDYYIQEKKTLHCSCLMYSLKTKYKYLFYKFTHTKLVYNRDLNDGQTRFYH